MEEVAALLPPEGRPDWQDRRPGLGPSRVALLGHADWRRDECPLVRFRNVDPITKRVRRVEYEDGSLAAPDGVAGLRRRHGRVACRHALRPSVVAEAAVEHVHFRGSAVCVSDASRQSSVEKFAGYAVRELPYDTKNFFRRFEFKESETGATRTVNILARESDAKPEPEDAFVGLPTIGHVYDVEGNGHGPTGPIDLTACGSRLADTGRIVTTARATTSTTPSKGRQTIVAVIAAGVIALAVAVMFINRTRRNRSGESR
jgi:hypothetical protein